jgi:hypothetical protein
MRSLKEQRIARDLAKRSAANEESYDAAQKIERRVLALDVDWDAFYTRLGKQPDIDDPCDGQTISRRVLTELLRENPRYKAHPEQLAEDVENCLVYFELQDGCCDCQIIINTDIHDPKPITHRRCHDCSHDFDEYYMVRHGIWAASGLRKGLLCVGCLEKRIGRQLHADDFPDFEVNIDDSARSLRLRTRMKTPPPNV